MAVFDRGLSGKKRLSDISLDNIRLVTRINANTKMEKYETLPFSTIKGQEDQTVVMLEDSLVYCFTKKGKKVESPFRRIVCKQKQTGEILYFLTNMMDVSAMEVAQIYRLRWDIELFFKFIKQYFSFSHLLSRKEHIIQIMLYMTMIAASMIYIYRKINEIESFKIAKMRFVNHLQIDLLTIIWKSGYANELFSKENFAT